MGRNKHPRAVTAAVALITVGLSSSAADAVNLCAAEFRFFNQATSMVPSSHVVPGSVSPLMPRLFAQHRRVSLGPIGQASEGKAFQVHLVGKGTSGARTGTREAQGLRAPELLVSLVQKKPTAIPSKDGQYDYLVLATLERFGMVPDKSAKPILLTKTMAYAVLEPGRSPSADLILPPGPGASRIEVVTRRPFGGVADPYDVALTAQLASFDGTTTVALIEPAAQRSKGDVEWVLFDLAHVAQIYAGSQIPRYADAVTDRKGPDAAAVKQLLNAMGDAEAVVQHTMTSPLPNM